MGKHTEKWRAHSISIVFSVATTRTFEVLLMYEGECKSVSISDSEITWDKVLVKDLASSAGDGKGYTAKPVCSGI